MRVEQLPGMEVDQTTRLQAAGINSCRQLLRASQRPEQLLALARDTGLSPKNLQGIVRRAELSQIRGIGSATLARLVEVGVDSLQALAACEPRALRMELQRVTTRPPNLAVIEDWVLQARKKDGILRASSLQASLSP
jgi:nucleotidyltransferase/DNA polymerase involved in DNA repair